METFCFVNRRIAVEDSADESGAQCETVLFLDYFKDLPDARQIGEVKYPLDEILLLCLLAVVAGADTITDIAKFGRLKLALLRRFRPFEDGTPAHDHLGDILAALDNEHFARCFAAWVGAQTGVPFNLIPMDGKTPRRSGSKTSKKKKDLKVRSTSCRPSPRANAWFSVRSRWGKVQRDRRHPQAPAHAGDRGRGRDHRRDGLSTRNRADDPRQEGRLHPRPQRQSGHAQRRRRALRRRAEGRRLQDTGSAATRPSTAITVGSKPARYRSFTMSDGCRNATIGPA